MSGLSKMGKFIAVEGFEAVQKAIAENKGKGDVYLWFSGSKDASGKSWCPDCVSAEPIIKSKFESVDDAVLIYCGVGDRAFWKDQKNIFRTHADFKLTCVPTLMKLGTKQRLNDSDCQRADMVEMMFE
eukprot:Colp12_sorted_trinity150504_noHs@35374